MDLNDAMDNDDTQSRTFPKKGPTDDAAKVGNTGRGSDSKELGESTLEMTKAGGPAPASGPTGSSRSYPKGSKPSTDAGRFNPMNTKPVGYATKGVGTGET